MPASRPAGPASPAPPHSIGCALSLPCQSGPTLRLLDCSYVRHTSNPLVSPAHQHVSRASSQLHTDSTLHRVRVRCVHCGCPPPPVPPCRGRSLARLPLTLTRAAPPSPPSISLGRSRSSRRSSRPSDGTPPHPAVPRACGPGRAGLRRYPQPHPALAHPPRYPATPPHTTAPHPHLRPTSIAQEAAGDRDAAHGDPGSRQAGRRQVMRSRTSLLPLLSRAGCSARVFVVSHSIVSSPISI